MAAGIKIDPYQPIGVMPQAVPGGGYQKIDAAAGDFGQSIGAGLEKLGQGAQQASSELAKYLQQEAARDNERVVKEADVVLGGQARDALYDPDNGYLATRGVAATERAKPTIDAMLKRRDDAMAQLTNDDQRRMFRDVSNRRLELFNDQVAKHSMAERLRAQDQASTTRIAGAVRDAATYSDNDKALQDNIGLVISEVQDQGQRNGWDADTIKLETRRKVTAVVAAQIGANLDDNPLRARQLLTRYGAQLDGAAATELDKRVRDAEVRVGSQADAQAIRNGIAPTPGASADNNIGNIIVSPFTYAGGKGRPEGGFETFEKPEQGVAAAYITMRAKAKQNGGTISFLDLIGGNATVQGWAPAPKPGQENDPRLKGNDPQTYATRLAGVVGMQPGDALPLNDDAKMAKILAEMNRVEKKGGQTTVPDAAFADGIRLAKGEPVAPSATDKPAPPPIDPETGRPTLDWQLQQADLIRDPERREATKARIRSQYQSDRAVVANRQDQAANAATQWLDANVGKPAEDMPSAIWNDLSDRQRNAAREAAKAGGNVETRSEAWYVLRRAALSSDPETRRRFASANALEWRHLLSSGDLKEVTGWQQAIRKGDTTQLAELAVTDRQVATAMKSVGINPAPPPDDGAATKRAGDFMMDAQRRFGAFERQIGRKLDDKQRQTILDQMLLDLAPAQSPFAGMGPNRVRTADLTMDKLSPDNRKLLDTWPDAIRREGFNGPVSDRDLLTAFAVMQNEPSLRAAPYNVPRIIAALLTQQKPVTDSTVLKTWQEYQRRNPQQPAPMVTVPMPSRPR